MELINNTQYPAKIYQTISSDGCRFASIVVKASYAFPQHNNERARPAEQQEEILLSDVFAAEPGLSAPLFESDLAPHKPRCDVLVHANAYTENSKPETELIVAFKLGACEKRILVTGKRIWKKGILGLTPSKTEKFTRIPINYGLAFGGQWSNDNPTDSICYNTNPIGCGFAKGKFVKQLLGSNLPNLNEHNRFVNDYSGNYCPMSFGPIGRSWQPRLAYAGTYNEHWKENIFPLPPADLNDLYYQSAPADQQIDYPKGGELLSLWNLHPTRPLIQFPLPQLTLPIHLVTRDNKTHLLASVVDTLQIDCEKEQLHICWRTRFPIRRSLREIEAVVVGSGFKIWYQSHINQRSCCGDEQPTTNIPTPEVNS